MVAFRGVAAASVIASRGGVDPYPFAYVSRMQHEVSRREWMNGTSDVPGEGKKVRGEEENVVSVFLACISCGKAEEIHVFRDRGLPRRVYWDCLDCQKNENRFASLFKPATQRRSRSCE